MTIERNRYFTGELLDVADLAQEQRYFLQKARRHNRMLHGWGIVCGLGIRAGAAAGQVTVEPGYALDQCGDEIVVENEVTVDLCSEDDDGNAVSPCPSVDEQRKRVPTERSPARPLYIVIRYAECATRPVPAMGSVEYTRVRESFAIRVLTELPDSYRQHAHAEPHSGPCPDPQHEPWVILGEVVLDASQNVTNVDCQSHHRRLVTAEGSNAS